jgi:hypothetical protein
MIRTAYLRTYLPSAAIAGLPPHRNDVEPRALTKSRYFIWDESTADDAIYTTWQARQFVCPRNTRLRMLEGVLAFTKMHPGMPLLGDQAKRAYIAELAALRKSSRYAQGFILSSAWHVPLRWFGAFKADEREVYDAGGYTSVRYRTSLGEAIDRVHWAADVLDVSGFSEGVVERVKDLEHWLVDFGADSMIELDYAETAKGFTDADLAFDESADDVRSSLLALEQGDFQASGDAYERVARRWADPQSYTFSN